MVTTQMHPAVFDTQSARSEGLTLSAETSSVWVPSRRHVLRTLLAAGGAAAGGLAAPAIVLASAVQPPVGAPRGNSAADFWTAPRWVWLTRPATGEQIRQVYWRDGQLIQSGYEAISWFMRDVRFERMLKSKDRRIHKALDAGRIEREHLTPWMLMDPVILDILYAYCAWLHSFNINEPVVLTSALRHMLTNEITEGAARDSWHVKGGAADIVIPSVPTANAAAFGKWLSGGGVGLYASKRFVHLDRGRVRAWKS
jgi:uncharacterized protein YcbK (DUF882 family)